MGNSPSKDDPLPTSSNQTTPNLSAGGELEQQEDSSVQAALSRPTGSLSGTKGKEPTYSGSTSAIRIEKKTSIANAAVISSSKLQTSNNTYDNNNNTNNINSHNFNSSKSSPRRKHDIDLDMEIGVSMAKLLSNSATGTSPTAVSSSSVSSSPDYLYARPNNLFPNSYSSSADSERSNFVTSPVFTSSNDDLELSLSSYSLPLGDEKETIGSYDLLLEPIVECSASPSIESTPTPESLKVPKPKLKLSTYSLKSTSSSTVSSASASPPLFRSGSKKKEEVDLDLIIDRLLEIGMKKPSNSSSFRKKHQKDKLPLTSMEIKYILSKSRAIFLEQPTLLKLSPPVKIVGDIHGQFHDLIRIFNSCGYPPYTNYLFLGDYVDRGYKSLETILLLLCYKIKYPENFFMLRGNHESANITKIYGFYDECKRRLPSLTSSGGGSNRMWKSFIDVFSTLPIAATINDKVFCIHGGLSPDLVDLKQIENIKRPTDIPDRGLLADLLWSDPDPLIKNFSISNWPKNDRGVSYCFGKKHVDYFCSKFKIDLIVRGHMVVEDGYEFFNKRKLVTIFSAPNYCGEFDNFGAVMSVDKKLCCSFELLKPLK